MPYMSDRHRVEICLPAQMMLAAILAGVPEAQQKKQDFLDLKKDLIDLSWEAVIDLPPKQQHKLLQRVLKLHSDLNKEFMSDKEDIPKIALIEFHCIKFIIEDEYLQYTEGSLFDTSIQTFMASIEHHAQKEKVNASAIKQARKMLKFLQDQGYYPGVEPSD